MPGVVGAEPVALQALSYTPNDPQVANQWHHWNAGDTDSDLREAWDLAKGDTTVVVAIVDTGVQYNHADLGGATAPYTSGVIWHNWVEMGGTPGVDDDGNGFVDDFRGWDFVSSAVGVPGEDLSGADNDPKDYVGHGTFCAGMASTRTDNGVGIAGTAFKAKIMPLRVGWQNSPGGSGVVDMVFCAQAINYARQNGANVINCSWSNSDLPGLVSAVTAAINAGVTVCVAAGNDGVQVPPQNYLATRGDCVDVAATDINDMRAGFSNYGAWVDVSAAGSSVYSTYSSAYTPTYATGSGTSYSSPFTAGVVALYQGYRKSLGEPLATPAQVLLRLRDTGDDIDGINGGFAGLVGTRLNAYRMLTDPPTSWANLGAGAFNSSPALVDLDGDGDEEIVIGGTDQKLVAVDRRRRRHAAGLPARGDRRDQLEPGDLGRRPRRRARDPVRHQPGPPLRGQRRRHDRARLPRAPGRRPARRAGRRRRRRDEPGLRVRDRLVDRAGLGARSRGDRAPGLAAGGARGPVRDPGAARLRRRRLLRDRRRRVRLDALRVARRRHAARGLAAGDARPHPRRRRSATSTATARPTSSSAASTRRCTRSTPTARRWPAGRSRSRARCARRRRSPTWRATTAGSRSPWPRTGPRSR